ncbi:MAG: ATP-binding cassette domain-containing protein, partial [bacterium]|nr:ATP-binding cassette domain-containing protein [bacterium]
MSEPAMQHEGNHVASRDPGERETLMVLEIEELCVRRTGDGRLLLSDVSFQLAAGQYGIVTGRSGVGKSLLFQAILGLLPEDVFEVTGTVRFGDHLILGPDGYDSKLLEQCLGGSIAAIFQEPTSHLHPSLPVGWQLRETWDANSWRLTEHDLQVVRDRLAAVVLTDNESAPLHSRYAFQLSQGQQQRAMFAMATGDAELVLADEPTSSLDENTEHEIVDLVRGLRDAGSFVSMLAITHNLDAFRPFLEDQDLVIEIALVDGVGRAIASHPVSA